MQDCPICCQPLYASVVESTICGHVYHQKCLEKLKKKSSYCAICRTNLNQNDYINTRVQLTENNKNSNNQAVNANNNHDQVLFKTFKKVLGLFLFVIALGGVGIGGFFVANKITHHPNGLQIFQLGFYPNAIFAIGMFPNGIFCIGVVSTGFFSLCVVGIGLLGFFGQVGAGGGFAIFQLGASMYVWICQVGLGFWKVRKGQCGLSIISPLFFTEQTHRRTCQGNAVPVG